MDYSPYGPGYNAVAVEEVPTGQYAPMSAWKYYGYRLLFALPLVGFICLIVFSFRNGNQNRRSFARSYWCGLLVNLTVIFVTLALLLVTGTFQNVLDVIMPLIQNL